MDRYQITSELGRGGMGITYAATDTETGDEVVLKRLDVSRMADWKALELFRREARVLRHLDHPGIPAYVDAFNDEETGTFTLVQARAPGKTLRQWIADGWEPSEDEVWDIAEQLLGVLVYLQGLNPPVIHRDLKPANVVRDDEGRVMLVDFGAVRDVYVQTITGGSTIIGTFGYMAPEQLQGQADLTTDLYGLGTTLLFCLTGEEPSALPQSRMRYAFEALDRVSPPTEGWLAPMVEPTADDRVVSASAALAMLERARLSPEEVEAVRWSTVRDLARATRLEQWRLQWREDAAVFWRPRWRTAGGPVSIMMTLVSVTLLGALGASPDAPRTFQLLASVLASSTAVYWVLALTGKEEIVLERERLWFVPGLGLLGRRRQVNRSEVAALSSGTWRIDSWLTVHAGNWEVKLMTGHHKDRVAIHRVLSAWAGFDAHAQLEDGR